MRNVSLLTLGLVALLILAVSANADDEKLVRHIDVTGTVETKVAPDRVIWSVRLTDTSKDMREAKAANDEKVKAVLALRKKLGVEQGDIETGQISIHREYERDSRGGRGEFKHFVVTRNVTIRQRDLKQFDKFLDELVESAEMEVSFRFDYSKMHEVRAETRLEALKVAKKKAEDMAEVVDAEVGQVLSISEHGEGGGWGYNVISNAQYHNVRSTPSTDLATDRFMPGAMTVRMTVYVTFALK